MSLNNLPLIGQRFGRLVVTAKAPGESRNKKWVCACDCGQSMEAIGGNLRRGATTSCGCLRRERNNHTTHGQTGTLTHKRWRAMRARCLDPNSKAYPRYGGRGITICERWLASFEHYLADMGECPGPDWTVDRKDNDLGYTPDNCRWATSKEQNLNRSTNRLIDYQGETLCISEWAGILGINQRTIMSRLNKGWSDEDALGTPVRSTKSRRLA